MEEDTMHLKKETESKIFNTSIRGIIALCLTVALCLALALVVTAPFLSVPMPDRIADQVIALFSAGFGAGVNMYFNQRSREGQKA